MPNDRIDLERDTIERMARSASRRRFLKWSGATVVVAGAGIACDDDNGPSGPGDGGPVVTLPLQNDTDILKFALFLELLEEDFYTKAVAAGILSGNVLDLTQDVLQHESAHVDFLQTALSGQAFTQDDVEFDFSSALTDQGTYLGVAQTLEQTGVNAYLGALPSITSRSNRTAAGSIFTIEARHTAAFRAFNNAPGGPVPDAFEDGLTPEQVVQAVVATGFVVEGL
ncbi:MAG: ferritin-like domain-containing protein [Gemmatimonadota bacterium]